MAQKKNNSAAKRFWDWLTLASYEAAKAQGTNDVVSRYARGNVLFQNGAVLDENEAKKLSEAGDKAVKRLEKRFKAA